MTYNMRVLIGLAVILLMAVVFAQPVLAQGTETYGTILGFGDMTTGYLTNGNFEANVDAVQGTYYVAYTGWSLNTGSAGYTVWTSKTQLPGDGQITSTNIAAGGMGYLPVIPHSSYLGNVNQQPTLQPSILPPVGYTISTDQGQQVLAAFGTCFMAQTIRTMQAPT